MTRRTFQKRAALFVLGCALQVCGALPKVRLPEVVENKAIPNPAWETATYRVEIVWHPKAMAMIGCGSYEIRTNNPRFLSDGARAVDVIPQYLEGGA